MRTARYVDGEEVGVSRTIEAGKLTQVACSSRVPTRPSRFFAVDLAAASAERISLAEKALSACAEWSTATCEGFREQGLFDKNQPCDCDSQCKQPGTCVLADGRCTGPTSQDDCAASRGCKTDGFCTFNEGQCEVRTDADCEGSTECAEHGLCGARRGVCVPTAAGCAASLGCKTANLCVDFAHTCVEGNSRPAADCVGPCAESVAPAKSEPVVLGERRSTPLWGLGVSVSILGGAAMVGGIGTWTILGDEATGDHIAASVAMAVGGLAAVVGGLAMVGVYGEREPVKTPPAKATPAKAALVVRPVVGPLGAGLAGEF